MCNQSETLSALPLPSPSPHLQLPNLQEVEFVYHIYQGCQKGHILDLIHTRRDVKFVSSIQPGLKKRTSFNLISKQDMELGVEFGNPNSLDFGKVWKSRELCLFRCRKKLP